MEKKKSYLLIYILVVVLIIGIGSSFAYFVSGVSITGNGGNAGGTTATIQDVNMSVDGNINVTTSNKDIYPGHKSVSSIRVTATGDRAVNFDVNWIGTSTFSTLKYKIYKTTSDLSSSKPSITCNTVTSVTNGQQYLSDSCTENNFGSLGSAIAEGTITTASGEQTKTLLSNQSITATSSGSSVYYYIVIEYVNTSGSQNTDMTASFNGKVNVSIPE